MVVKQWVETKQGEEWTRNLSDIGVLLQARPTKNPGGRDVRFWWQLHANASVLSDCKIWDYARTLKAAKNQADRAAAMLFLQVRVQEE